MPNVIIISGNVQEKLSNKHHVTKREISQCFDNRCGEYLIDDRENNRTDPPTLWFVAETNQQRLLKVAFIFKDGNFYIKTAYEPNAAEITIYDTYGK